MKFGASRSQLYDAHKSASARHEEVSKWWSDSTKEAHDEKVWQPFDDYTRDCLRGIDQLTAIFAEIRRQCEFNDE